MTVHILLYCHVVVRLINCDRAKSALISLSGTSNRNRENESCFPDAEMSSQFSL